MMITVYYDLDNEDDAIQYDKFIKLDNYRNVIRDFQDYLRHLYKYTENTTIDIQELYTKWNDILVASEVDPYED